MAVGPAQDDVQAGPVGPDHRTLAVPAGKLAQAAFGGDDIRQQREVRLRVAALQQPLEGGVDMAHPAAMPQADVAVRRRPAGHRADDAAGSGAVPAGEGGFVVVEAGWQVEGGAQLGQRTLQER